MVLTRDYELQQGDTKKIVIPVFDDDDPNNDYYQHLSAVDVEFAIAETFESSAAIWIASSSDVSITDFSNTKLGSDSFEFSDVDVSVSHTIPSTQDVIVVTIPKSDTESFAVGANVYQCRFEDTSTPSKRLTPVRGTVTVQESTPFTT